MSSFFENDSPSNLTEYSVSELSGSIKRTVENAFDQCVCAGKSPAIVDRIPRAMPTSR